MVLNLKKRGMICQIMLTKVYPNLRIRTRTRVYAHDGGIEQRGAQPSTTHLSQGKLLHCLSKSLTVNTSVQFLHLGLRLR
jgi:hypothetical protein